MNPFADVAESKASFQLALMGYRIIGGDVWMTTHEEPETGWFGNRVGQWSGSRADLYATLERLGFPNCEAEVQCTECSDADAALGELCASCGRQDQAETMAEFALEVRRGK